jgi:hypothetical protein
LLARMLASEGEKTHIAARLRNRLRAKCVPGQRADCCVPLCLLADWETMVRKSVLVSLAAAALPLSADAFTCGHNAALASRNPLGAGVRMCAQPGSEAAPVAMTKKSIVKKAVTLFSALSIGSAAAPIASRARDMPALPMDTALVAEASVTEAPAKEKAGPLKSIAIGGIAGAAGFGSVILLRKGLQKDTPSSPQEWADKKQKEWKVQFLALAAHVCCRSNPMRTSFTDLCYFTSPPH